MSYVPLGKYSNEFEDALHFMCTSGWSNGEFGSVEAPTGFVWKISNLWTDVSQDNTEFNSLMEEWFELNPTVTDGWDFRNGLVGHFLVREDSNGLVFLTTYKTTEQRDDAFHGLQDEFQKWDAQDDEEESSIYWDEMSEYGPEDGVEIVTAFGEGTARIIDTEAGGVIAYCHKDSAARIVMALRAAAAADEDDEPEGMSRIQEEHEYKFGDDRL